MTTLGILAVAGLLITSGCLLLFLAMLVPYQAMASQSTWATIWRLASYVGISFVILGIGLALFNLRNIP